MSGVSLHCDIQFPATSPSQLPSQPQKSRLFPQIQIPKAQNCHSIPQPPQKQPRSDLFLHSPRNGLLNMLPIRPEYPLRAHPRRIDGGFARENQRIVEKAAERAAEEWRDHRDPEVVS
jgi:hypothetical protein